MQRRIVFACSIVLQHVLLMGGAAADSADTPPQPMHAELGGEGPCSTPANLDNLGADVTVVTNLRHSTQKVWVIRPNGTGSPRTGGSCNDNRRPVVLFIHGFPVNQLVGQATVPSLYGDLIRNLVSQGNIVVFPTYNWNAVLNLSVPVDLPTLVSNLNVVAATVADGFEQVGNTSVRMDKRHLGVFGHSLGGGVALTVLNMLVGAHPDWAAGSSWLAVDSPTDLFYHCNDVSNPFAPPDPASFDYDAKCVDLAQPPANSLLLYLGQMGDSPTIHISTWRMYEDMPIPASRKWGVVIQNDCSHSGDAHCVNAEGELAANQTCPAEPATAAECMAGHLLPTIYSDRSSSYPPRQENHLNFYGLYRNLQALSECARSSASPSCHIDRTFMGVWSDGVAATPARNYP